MPVNTWHADAGKLPDSVQAGGVILARHRQALVDVDLAARAGVATAALALEGALGVHALSKVLARVGACRRVEFLVTGSKRLTLCDSRLRRRRLKPTNGALVHVLVAGSAHKAGRAGADSAAVERVGVAHGALVAGVADAGVVQVAQHARLAHGALAGEGGHAVVAGGAVEADGDGAVVNVLAAVVAGPAVDAHAGVAADGVEAGAAVVAGVGLHEALVDVLGAVLTWWRVSGGYLRGI